MKKMISIAVFLIVSFGGIRAQMRNNMVSAIITEQYQDLTPEQKSSVYNEVMKEETVQFLPLGAVKGSPEYGSTREILEGFIAEVINKIVPEETFFAQNSGAIFDDIKNKKGAGALESTKAVLKHLHAQLLEYFETKRGEPVVMRIKVPDQVGQTCGIHALANLLAVKKLVSSRYTPYGPNFIETSKDFFKNNFENCPKELVDVNVIADSANRMNFSNLVIVGAREGEANSVYTYPIVGQKNLLELLRDLVSQKKPVVDIVLHSQTIKQGKHSEHWTAVSIVYEEGMERPIVLFMDSLSNENFAPTNKTIQAALQYISDKVTDIKDKE